MNVAVLKRVLSFVVAIEIILSGVEAVGGVVKDEHINKSTGLVSTTDMVETQTKGTSLTNSTTMGNTECTQQVKDKKVESTDVVTEPSEVVVNTEKDTEDLIVPDVEEVVTEHQEVETFPNYDYVTYDNVLSSVPYYKYWDTIGYVTCDSADLNRVPINYGWAQEMCDSREIVMDACGQFVFGQGTSTFICGHNYNALRNLKNAKVGDRVLIETTYGGNYLYEIEYSSRGVVVQDTEWFYGIADYYTGNYVLQRCEQGNYLGIITCFDNNINNNRWFVKARLIKGTETPQKSYY